jgi:hypothetical protein
MILALLLMFHAQADEIKCPASEKFQFGSIELKLNLDGNNKQDAIVRFVANEGEQAFFRRALVFDAPKKIEKVTEDQWLETCQQGGEDPPITTITYEKVKAGKHDLLLSKAEGGTAGTFQYFMAKDGKLVPAFKYSNPSLSGHFNETRKKGLALRIVGEDGELLVNGEAVDLDGRAIKSRCRIRELHIQLKYEWDGKTQAFKEVDEGCVMDSAID